MGKEEGQQPREPGNITLAYPLSQSFKETIWGQNNWMVRGGEADGKNEARDLQVNALVALWNLRSHPHYLEYPESQGVKLSIILGELPTDPNIISVLLRGQNLASRRQAYEENAKNALWELSPFVEPTPDDFYSHSRMTQRQGDRNKTEPGVLIKVPEIDDLIKPGILTDVVVATGKKIGADFIPQAHYQGKPVLETFAERAGISPEEFKRYEVARLNYNLFVTGYIAPFIKEGTRAEQLLIGPRGPLRDSFIPIEEPAAYLKQNFGVEIKV